MQSYLRRAVLRTEHERGAGLNHTETGEIVDILRKVRDQGVTVLPVEHDMAVNPAKCGFTWRR